MRIQFSQDWLKAQNDISDSSRQKYTNKEIKEDYHLEEYLKIVRNPALRIQTGKYENKGAPIPVEDRLCLVCKRNGTEYEKHFDSKLIVLNTIVLDRDFIFVFLKTMQTSSI